VNPLPGILMRCLMAMAPATAPAAPLASPPTLAPTWTWSAGNTIEWVRAVGPACTPALLAATSTGQLFLLDAATGRPRTSGAFFAGRGVQAAGPNDAPDFAEPDQDQLAYVFDRQTVAALRTTEPAGVAWRHGRSLPDAETFPGDPEVLTGWIAAVPTARGLVALNSDGRVVLLDRAAGRELWTARLGGIRAGRLHACGSMAVAVWMEGGAARAAWITLSDEPPTVSMRELGEWPIWSRLVTGTPAAGGDRRFPDGPDGTNSTAPSSEAATAKPALVLVSPTGVTVMHQSGAATRFALAGPVRRTRLDSACTGVVHGQVGCSAPILLAAEDEYLRAYTLPSGGVQWATQVGGGAGGTITQVSVRAEWTLVTTAATATACRTSTGAAVATLAPRQTEGDRLLYAGIAAHTLWAASGNSRDAQATVLAWRALPHPDATAPGAALGSARFTIPRARRSAQRAGSGGDRCAGRQNGVGRLSTAALSAVRAPRTLCATRPVRRLAETAALRGLTAVRRSPPAA
jgi:hypothetical protein